MVLENQNDMSVVSPYYPFIPICVAIIGNLKKTDTRLRISFFVSLREIVLLSSSDKHQLYCVYINFAFQK